MISYYLPSGSKIGVGYQVHALANTLSRIGHNVTVFSGCGPTDGALYATLTVALSGHNRTFKFALKLRQVDWTVFDVLHAHGDDYWLFRCGVSAHIRTLHGSCFAEARWVVGHRERLRMVLLGFSELLASVIADRTVAVSHNTYRWAPWIKQVIPNGVDLDRFAAVDKSAVPSVLFVGTYGNRKRGRLLADVFEREVLEAIPDAQLWMVCQDAPLRRGVTRFGRIDDTELSELYSRAWAFCLPSSYEGFGIPYIEAMAAGTPVIATPNPGALEVTAHGRLGIIADDLELGSAIVRLLRSDFLREAIATEALAEVARFDLNSIAAQYQRLYEEAMDSKRRRRSGSRLQRV